MLTAKYVVLICLEFGFVSSASEAADIGGTLTVISTES